MRPFWIIVLLFAATAKGANTPGALDVQRNAALSNYTRVNAFLSQPDGGIIVGGANVHRLTADLQHDTNFATFKGDIIALVPWEAETFLAVSSSSLPVRKYDRNGHPDTNFSLQSSPGTVAALRDPDGNLLLAGGDVPVSRFFPDGRRDTNFQIMTPTRLVSYNALAVTAQSEILLGGEFAFGSSGDHFGIVRFDKAGVLDTSFKPLGTNSNVTAILALSDGRYLLDGEINAGGTNTGLTMIRADGSVDSTFQRWPWPHFLDYLKKIFQLRDGRFFICHEFQSHRDGLSIVLPNGSIDTNFLSSPIDVHTIIEREDGSFLVGGYFERNLSNTRRGGVALLHGYPDRLISMPYKTADGLFFEHSTVPGYNYVLQSATNLFSNDWTTITNFAGDGATNRWILPLDEPRSYFRLAIPY